MRTYVCTHITFPVSIHRVVVVMWIRVVREPVHRMSEAER